jgi:hypothetical protein
MDLNRLGQGHRIAAGAGLLLLIDLWLSWYSINDDFLRDLGGSFGVDTSANAWQAFDLTDILLAITALLAIAAAAQALGLLKLPVRLSDILFPLAAVMTIWVLYRIINQPEDNEVIDVSFGAWLGLVLTGVVAYGAMKARGEAEAVGPAGVSAPAASTPPPAAPPAPTTPPPPAPPAADEPPSSTNP